MLETAERRKVHFSSGDIEYAAWHYPGSNGACVVMAPGIGVLKEPGTDPLAERLVKAGFSVLAFDHRRLGESGGSPRQIARVREQLEDWQAAIRHARALPEVDPRRVAIWGFSLSGGHMYILAARNPDLAAAISQAGNADGLVGLVNAARHFTIRALLRLNVLALRDTIRGLFGREPILVPLTGPKGAVASITTPDAQNGIPALDPDNRYPFWQKEIAARSALRIGFYRPRRFAPKIQIPFLTIAYEQDGVTPPGPAIRAAKQMPHGELAVLSGGHYQAFMGGMQQTLDVMVPFLRRHLLDQAGRSGGDRRPGVSPAATSG